MYEAYCTYVDDKYFDNHDYDDDTDADTDNDTGDDTDDDINTQIIVRCGCEERANARDERGLPVIRGRLGGANLVLFFLGSGTP